MNKKHVEGIVGGAMLAGGLLAAGYFLYKHKDEMEDRMDEMEDNVSHFVSHFAKRMEKLEKKA